MFKRLKKIFNYDESETGSGKMIDINKHLNLATCVLLLEIATTDDDFSENEAEKIKSILTERYNISETDIKDLMKEAISSREDSTDLYEFTSILNTNLSKEEKLKLISSIWEVIYADGVLDQYEDHLVHRLSDLLHIEHEEMIEAKIKAKPADYKGR